MKRIIFTNPFVLSLLIALVILTGACSSEKKKDTESEKTKTTEKVQVMEVALEKINKSFEFTSTLQAFQEVYYAPASPGRINKINVEVGSRFNEGDVLVEMDQTQLHQAKIQLKTLEVDMARFDTLINSNSIPKQQYDQLKAQYDIALNNVKFLEENNRLKAPFTGIVSGKYFQNGEMYSGAPNNQVGKAAVVSLVQINPLKAIVNVTEQLFPIIKNNMTVSLVTDIYPDKIISGKVLRIYPTIDQVSRTFLVEILIPNTNEDLRPGMFCRATFVAGEIEAVLVPTLAVLKVQGSNERYVFIDNNGRAKRVNVTIGRRFDNKVEIISKDINVGDKIIISGQARLVNDVNIEVVK